MSRIEIVPDENEVVIKSKLQVDSSFVNKIENPVNKDRIRAHLKDMKAEHKMVVDKNTIFSVLSTSIYEPMDGEDFDRTLRVLAANHNAFFENVSERMPEVQLKEETTDEENEKISVVTDLLKSIDQLEPDEYVAITDRIGFIGIALAEINVGLLREILDTYVDKHMSK